MTETDGPVVDIRGLDVIFATDGGDVHAVRNVSLDVRRGEVLAIVGESGSGKTVTSRTILRLLPETAVRCVRPVVRNRSVRSSVIRPVSPTTSAGTGEMAEWSKATVC